MHPIKKVLLVQGDESACRSLTLLLAGAGYDVRSYTDPAAAIKAVQGEWFELSLVAEPLPKMDTASLVGALRTWRPGLAVLLLVGELELSAVINGIRMSVTDVLAPRGDWSLVLRRVNAILRPARHSSSKTSSEGSAEIGGREVWRDGEVDLREESMKLRMGHLRLDREHRQLQNEMELLRETEANLRTYEQRLRTMSTEAEDSKRTSAAPWMSRLPVQMDERLEAAWMQVDREADRLKAERRDFNDEKVVLKQEIARLRAKEEELRKREEVLAARESRPPEPPVQAAPVNTGFSQAPFKAVRAIFTSSKA